MKFIDSEFKVYHIATLFEQENRSHAATDMAQVLSEKYKDVLNIVVKDDVVYVTSDTTGSAQNVADQLELLQDDCEMHVLNLILGYAAGLKENTATRWDEDHNGSNPGGRKKVTQFVTPGGQFKRAAEIVKIIKQISQVSYLMSFNKLYYTLTHFLSVLDQVSQENANFEGCCESYESTTYYSHGLSQNSCWLCHPSGSNCHCEQNSV